MTTQNNNALYLSKNEQCQRHLKRLAQELDRHARGVAAQGEATAEDVAQLDSVLRGLATSLDRLTGE